MSQAELVVTAPPGTTVEASTEMVASPGFWRRAGRWALDVMHDAIAVAPEVARMAADEGWVDRTAERAKNAQGARRAGLATGAMVVGFLAEAHRFKESAQAHRPAHS